MSRLAALHSTGSTVGTGWAVVDSRQRSKQAARGADRRADVGADDPLAAKS